MPVVASAPRSPRQSGALHRALFTWGIHRVYLIVRPYAWPAGAVPPFLVPATWLSTSRKEREDAPGGETPWACQQPNPTAFTERRCAQVRGRGPRERSRFIS